MAEYHLDYFNSLIRKITLELLPRGKALTQEDRNIIYKKCEELLSGTPQLFREFMTARTNRSLIFPEKSGDS